MESFGHRDAVPATIDRQRYGKSWHLLGNCIGPAGSALQPGIPGRIHMRAVDAAQPSP